MRPTLFIGWLLLGSFSFSIAEAGRSQTRAYYNDLREKCRRLENPGCCLASVRTMQKDDYQLVPSSGTCPSGFSANMYRCLGSYSWCEPKPEPTKMK